MGSISVQSLDWNEFVSLTNLEREAFLQEITPTPIDLVIAADVVYRRELFPSLLNTICGLRTQTTDTLDFNSQYEFDPCIIKRGGYLPVLT